MTNDMNRPEQPESQAPLPGSGHTSHAHPAFHLIDARPETEGPWSAHHLPAHAAPRALRLSLVFAAAGLVAVVLVAAVAGPIRTAGSQMEPSRFKAAAEVPQAQIRVSAATAGALRTAPPAHR